MLVQPAGGSVELWAPCEANTRVTQGSLEVISGEMRRVVAAGQRDMVATQKGVQFDTTKSGGNPPLPSSDPAFHGSHQHIGCDAWHLKSPLKMPMGEKAFIVGAAVGTVIAVIKKPESAEGP
jgi:hypothetical protein